MCGAEHETRGADAIEVTWAGSGTRRVQKYSGTDKSRPVNEGGEAYARAYTYIASVVVERLLVSRNIV